jgi:hypothetical protein
MVCWTVCPVERSTREERIILIDLNNKVRQITREQVWDRSLIQIISELSFKKTEE